MTLLIMNWNVAGAFFILNGITIYWKNPSGVINADISFIPASNHKQLTNFETPIQSLQSSILGFEYESDFVAAFTFQKSV